MIVIIKMIHWLSSDEKIAPNSNFKRGFSERRWEAVRRLLSKFGVI